MLFGTGCHAQNLARIIDKLLASVGEPHLLPDPPKQAHTLELLLQHTNMLAYSWLRHMQTLGCGAIATSLDDSYEGLEMDRIEHAALAPVHWCRTAKEEESKPQNNIDGQELCALEPVALAID